MPRTQLEVEVIGLDQVKAMNTALTTHGRIVSQLAGTYQQFNSAVGASAGAVRQAAGAQQSLGSSLQSNNANLATARQGHENLLTTLLRYRLVSEVFHGVQESIQAAGKAFLDYNYQAGRTVRINGGSGRQVEAELRVGTAMTGLDPKAAGETYYQLGTFIKDSTQLARTFKEEMKLVNGTEGDARDTARASVQIYEDFGDQLGKNTSVSEKFRRANELLAITFKDSHAEIGEISNALKYLAPIAETAGVKVEQLFAVMTALTAKGVRGRMEGTEAGAFISRLIKAYNDGVGGIESKGKVYHFDFAKDAQGGLDLIKTLEDIHRRHQELQRTNQSAAREYLTAIGGQQNAIRFLGTMSDSTLNRMEGEWQKNKLATAGLTHEVDGLNNAINATASKQAARAWESFLGVLSLGLADVYDKLSKIQLLHDFVKGLRADLQMNASNEERGQQLQHQTPIEHALDMRNLLRIAGQGHTGNEPIPISELREGNALRPTEVDALLQLVPKRFAEMPGFGRDRYTTADDLKAAIAKINADIPKFQQERLASLHGGGAHSLSIPDVADLARHAGFSESQIPRAVAIAMAESSLNPRNRSVNSDRFHSVDRGLWQINDHYHNEVSDAAAMDPMQNALAAFRISHGGANWQQWTTYRTGAYKQYLGQVEQALSGGKGHYSGASITDAPADPDKAADERERAIEEARRKHLDILHDRQRIAQDDFREAQKRVQDFGKDQDIPLDPKTYDAKLKPLQDAAEVASKRLTNITKQVAQVENDPATLRLIQKGTLIEGVDMDAMRQANLEKYVNRREKLTEFYAGEAQRKYGVSDPITEKRAQEAQQAAIEAAKLDTQDPTRLWKLQSGLEGPMFDLKQRRQEEQQQYADNAKNNNEGWSRVGMALREGIVSNTEARLRDIDLSQRPENLFSNQKEGALDALTGKQNVLQQGLEALGPATTENKDQFEKLSDELRQVNQEIGNFKDRIAASDFEKKLADLGDKTRQRLELLDMKSGTQLYLNPDSAQSQQRQLLQETIGYYASNLADVQAASAGVTGDAAEKGKKAVEQAQLQLEQSKYNLQHFDSEKAFRDREHFAGMASSAAVELYHGEKPDKVFSKLGDQVVSNAIQKLIGSAFDPHTVAVKQNTLAVQSLTGAISGGPAGTPMAASGSLTDAVQKLGDTAGADGGAGGGSAGAGSSGLFSPQMGKYVNAGLGAYGIFSQGEQQGITAGGILGGAAAGAEIGASFGPQGALIGAAAGGLLSLVGGLFHHSKPAPTNQDINPGAYNSPDAFDYSGYRYLAFMSEGKKGFTNQQLGLPNQLSPMPTQSFPNNVTIHLNIEGLGQKVVQATLGRSTTLGSVSLNSHDFDNHQPV